MNAQERPVLGELRRGKTDPISFLLITVDNSLRYGGVLKRVEKPDTDFIVLIIG